MNTHQLKISNDLYLVRHTLPLGNYTGPDGIDHIIVIDCSGSMSYDLPKIRQQLKSKLVSLVGAQDTVSIIWFSGRNEFGVLVDAEPVADLRDLSKVHAAIDRWLKPVGLTGFAQPLNEAMLLAGRVRQPNRLTNLFFMSDGHDNQSSRSDIISFARGLSTRIDGATVVEYGHYADRQLLSEIAQAMGGELIFSQGFADYEASFENAIEFPSTGRMETHMLRGIEYIENLGFAFFPVDQRILMFEIDDVTGAVTVPNYMAELWTLRSAPQPEAYSLEGHESESALYAALSIFATRMRPEVIYPILRQLGDVRFIKQFTNCFGKQAYTEFQEAARAALFDDHERFTEGEDFDLIPADDAFTVLDFLALLDEDDRLLLDHAAFKYNRISRGREVKPLEVPSEVNQLLAVGGREEIRSAIATLQTLVDKPETEFTPDPAPDGYAVDGITYHSSRANISLRIKKTGTIHPGTLWDLPQAFPTFVWRNYAIVKDGMVNVSVLPIKPSADTAKMLEYYVDLGKIASDVIERDGDVWLVHLDKLPIINRSMVKASSAKELVTAEYGLLTAKAAAKVVNYYTNTMLPATRFQGLAEEYGEDAAAFLASLGVTDNGYAPKVEQAESIDVYPAKEMSVKLKGLSSLPAVDKVKAKIADGKALTGGETLLQPMISTIESFLTMDLYKLATDPTAALSNMLRGLQRSLRCSVRMAEQDIAQQKFATIVSQTWFADLPATEDSITVDLNGSSITGTIEQRWVEVKI